MRLRPTLPLIAALISGVSLAAEATRKFWDFEKDEPGRIASGFTNDVGQWEVARDGDNQVLYQKAKNDDATFNVALAAGTNFKDLELSVKLRAVAGEVDRGGGLVWRRQGRQELLHRPLQPARGQLPRLQGPGRQAYPVPVGKDSRRRQVAHAPRDDDGDEDRLLPRWPEAPGSRGRNLPRSGNDRPVVQGRCAVVLRRPGRERVTWRRRCAASYAQAFLPADSSWTRSSATVPARAETLIASATPA